MKKKKELGQRRLFKKKRDLVQDKVDFYRRRSVMKEKFYGKRLLGVELSRRRIVKKEFVYERREGRHQRQQNVLKKSFTN